MRRVAEQLAGETLAGFYTEEMRARGERRGFRLVAFNGKPVVIAHVDFPKTHRVGKYGVDVAAIDKMECLSERFVARMRGLLAGSIPVIATLAKRGAGFIAEVKRREDCELWTLTRANRDALPFEIINRKH